MSFFTRRVMRELDLDESGDLDLDGIMEGYLREAVAGHPKGINFITHCWDQRYQYQDLQLSSAGQA